MKKLIALLLAALMALSMFGCGTKETTDPNTVQRWLRSHRSQMAFHGCSARGRPMAQVAVRSDCSHAC